MKNPAYSLKIEAKKTTLSKKKYAMVVYVMEKHYLCRAFLQN